jgi:hypothetical protein
MGYVSIDNRPETETQGWSFTDKDGDMFVMNTEELRTRGWLLIGGETDVLDERGQIIYPEDLENLKILIEKAQEYLKERTR